MTNVASPNSRDLSQLRDALRHFAIRRSAQAIRGMTIVV